MVFPLLFRSQQTTQRIANLNAAAAATAYGNESVQPPSECPIVRLSRQFASRPTQSHQRTTNNVKLSLYNFSRGKPGGGKCRGRQLRRLPWRPKLSAVCEQLETYESCLPNNNKINCARRGEKGVLLGVTFSGGRGKRGFPRVNCHFVLEAAFVAFNLTLSWPSCYAFIAIVCLLLPAIRIIYITPDVGEGVQKFSLRRLTTLNEVHTAGYQFVCCRSDSFYY